VNHGKLDVRAGQRPGSLAVELEDVLARQHPSISPAWVVARVRRPTDMTEATRWLFATLFLVSLLISLPVLLTSGNATTKFAGVASTAVLGLSLGAGYLRRRAPFGMDLVDATAVLVVGLASPSPVAVLGFVFAALWFRSLYGSSGRALLRCGFYAAALAASLPLWPLVPGHAGGTEIGPVVGVIPTMFLTVIVGRHLAGIVLARDRAARLDAVHVSVGVHLLGVTDAEEVRRVAWRAISAICAAFPGLRVMKVDRDGTVLRVGGAAGGFAGVPATLPVAMLSQLGPDGEPDFQPIEGRAELDAAVGVACAWVHISLPEVNNRHSAWLLLGTPRTVPAEAIGAISSLANQVTLALRSSEVHEELTVQATLDNLTGLANRASFNNALSVAIDDQRAQPTTVLFVDLDDFKDVNDRLGHGAGDELLREIARRLRQTTRPGDVCARLGGDEFAVLLRSTDGAAAAEVAQRIVQAVGAPAHLDRGVANVGASVGVATATGETDVEELIQRADVAMYAAKANGKARVQVFESGLLQGNSPAMLFERQLASAAAKGELVIHYQPVLSLPDLRCTAVEALVRWQHPEQGLLYPGNFIDVAERTGAIHDIGAYVLRHACADLVVWRNAHPGSSLALHVNVSALQLDDEDFLSTVTQCLREFALPPSTLVLEITETVVISSVAAIDRLNALAAYGVTIAVDDFGTGYSALTTLRSLPVEVVKIDRSFVAGSTVNAEDRAVTEAVVKMAAQMGMRTIAEGVERLDQQSLLESIGADAVQGFLYLRPTTAADFAVWLETNLAAVPVVGATHNVVVPLKPRHTA
jgi:diguanylate cyclase (GGDEF)-like protein